MSVDPNVPLTDAQLVRLHDLMLRARCLEERLIAMYKQGDGYFWIGGPGEEAFNVPLGLLVHKGQGPDYDYLHLHYRNSATLLAMGADPVDALRQMKNTATDPYSGGRNFCGHYSLRKWNVVPVTSTIETQYTMAPGTALAQKRRAGHGITIVTGGDAGTAEGDFASCLVWSSRPVEPLPVLIIVTNNQWGISTAAAPQHGERTIADRARSFGIESNTIDGNDPETSWRELARAMDYVRTTRRPYLLEAQVSRLHGHSSASGANPVLDEPDCLQAFELKLEQQKVLTREHLLSLRARYTQELADAHRRVLSEAKPDPESIHDHLFQTRDLVRGG